MLVIKCKDNHTKRLIVDYIKKDNVGFGLDIKINGSEEELNIIYDRVATAEYMYSDIKIEEMIIK